VAGYPSAGISGCFKIVFPDIDASNPPGYDSGSVEDVIASGTQVVFGPDQRLTEERRLQLQKAGVAVVSVAGIGSVEAIRQSFLIIGDILGPEERRRAERFAAYYRGNVAEARRLGAQVPEGGRLKVMILSGRGGALSTVNSRDIVHEHIEAAGGQNVAAGYMPESRGMALAVDPEAILAWDPDLIVAYSRETRREILENPALAGASAVRNGRVLACPQGIYLWGVRSGEGAMMALWLGSRLYPDLIAGVAVKAMVRDFFQDFYGYRLRADELEAILLGGPGQ
jgi:iron complex transport system substrate-binding protein